MGPKSDFADLRGGLLLTLPFLEMLSSSAFKGKTCRPQFVQTLSGMIDKCEAQVGVKQMQTLEETRRALF